MAAFAGPFTGNIERKITKTELIQAIRIDIAAELEAIYLYDAHAHATDDPLARKVLMDIRDEEKEHVGELLTLMRTLDPDFADFLNEGEGEVRDMMKELEIEDEDISTRSLGSLVEEV